MSRIFCVASVPVKSTPRHPRPAKPFGLGIIEDQPKPIKLAGRKPACDRGREHRTCLAASLPVAIRCQHCRTVAARSSKPTMPRGFVDRTSGAFIPSDAENAWLVDQLARADFEANLDWMAAESAAIDAAERGLVAPDLMFAIGACG